MKPSCIQLAASIFAASIITCTATVRYVDVNNPNPATPYTTWATAGRVIQDAVDAAVSGDEVVVTNGTYATGGRAVRGVTTNRVAVDKPMVVRSVNGPEVTIIQGRQIPGTTNGVGAVRCAYLTNGASLSGFTLTGGATETLVEEGSADLASGGGVWCEAAALTNCTFLGNAADYYGGGCFRGTVDNSRFLNNSVAASGGLYGGGGGGAYATLINCLMVSNSAFTGGATYSGTLSNCTLIGNAATVGGGAANSTLNNCLVISNTAARDERYGHGLGGGAYSGFLYNCTLVGNEGSGAAGMEGGHFCCFSYLKNCILAHNSCSNCIPFACVNCGAGQSADLGPFVFADNCCVAGDPRFVAVCWEDLSGTSIPWLWSITGDPRFVDEAAGDLRLRSDSPCINAGRNDYAPAGTDFDGNPRIVGSAVDIGAFEFQSPQSTLPYWWLQQYALPTDGSADAADSDGDGHNNWQEWRADTVPTNALSQLTLIAPTNAPTGLAVTWQSVATRSYFLERGTNLADAPAMLALATNIPGQAGTTSFTDTNVSSGGPFFYRVGVQ